AGPGATLGRGNRGPESGHGSRGQVGLEWRRGLKQGGDSDDDAKARKQAHGRPSAIGPSRVRRLSGDGFTEAQWSSWVAIRAVAESAEFRSQRCPGDGLRFASRLTADGIEDQGGTGRWSAAVSRDAKRSASPGHLGDLNFEGCECRYQGGVGGRPDAGVLP